MFIDFKDAKLPEGLTQEMLADSGLQDFIKAQFDTSFQARFEIQASGLKDTNEQLKKEKTELKGHLDKFNEIDLEEYARLQELKKTNGDATSQIERLTAERDAIKTTLEEKLANQEAETNELRTSLHSEQLGNEILAGIRQHNKDFPAVALHEGSEPWVIEEAHKIFKRNDNGEHIPMNGDQVMTGKEGVMTPAEWAGELRKTAKFAPLYKAPAGGGAPGGSGGANGPHFNPKDIGGTKDERTAAFAARHPELAGQ